MRASVACIAILVASSAALAQSLTFPVAPNGPFRNELRLNEDPAAPGALNNRGNTNRNTGRSVDNFGNVFIAGYVSEENSGLSTSAEIYVNISRDNGRTWSLPTRVSPTDGFLTSWPQVHVGPDPLNPGGLIFNAVALDRRKSATNAEFEDVRSFWSTDGIVWTEATYATSMMGMNPAAGQATFDVDEFRSDYSKTGVLHVVGEDQGRKPGCASGGNESVWHCRSVDGGRSFQAFRWLDTFVLGTGTCQASDVNNPNVKVDGDFVVVAWNDNSEQSRGVAGAGRDLWAATSVDGGASFIATVAETNGLGGELGEISGNQIAVQEYQVPGGGLEYRAAILFEDTEAALVQSLPAAGSVTLITTNDGGATWSPEVDIDPSITNTANAGAEYLNISLNGEIITVAYCSDQFSTTINGAAPALGNNDDFREAFFAISYDFGVTFTVPVDLDVIPGANRANNEIHMKSDGLTTIINYQVNPFGTNDDAWNWTADGGLTFAGSQIIFSSFFGDVDRGGTFENWLSVNFDDLSAVSIYGINTTGQNEDYLVGLKFPFLTSSFAAAPAGTEQLGVNGAFLPGGGESFLIGVSTSGNFPVTNLGNGKLLPLVVDPITLALLSDPILLAFTSGAINAGLAIDGGQALAFPAPAGVSFSLAGVRIGATGQILGTTDGVSIAY